MGEGGESNNLTNPNQGVEESMYIDVEVERESVPHFSGFVKEEVEKSK